MFENMLRRTGPSRERSGYPSAAEAACSCYVFTIKKSGTHLLKNLLEHLGMCCINHLDYAAEHLPEPPNAETPGFILSHRRPPQHWRGEADRGQRKIIMNIRDPRAVFLSLLDFFDWRVPLGHELWHAVEFRRRAYREAFQTREELGFALMEDEHLDDDPFSPWLNFRRSRTLFYSPSVLKVRYEDFFQESATEDLVTRVCRYLGRPEPENSRALLGAAIAAPSPTKNIMIPDRWRSDLPSRLLEAFMERHGDLVREYGYPPD